MMVTVQGQNIAILPPRARGIYTCNASIDNSCLCCLASRSEQWWFSGESMLLTLLQFPPNL